MLPKIAELYETFIALGAGVISNASVSSFMRLQEILPNKRLGALIAMELFSLRMSIHMVPQFGQVNESYTAELASEG